MKANLILTAIVATTPAALATPAQPPPAGSALAPAVRNRRGCANTVYPNLRTSPNLPPPYQISLDASTPPLEIGFTVPSDAVGPCSMMLSLPAPSFKGSGAQVNIVALDGPAAGSIVGTADFVAGAQTTINSFACRAQMCYSLQVVGGSAGASVGFGEDAQTGAGVSMTYC